MYRCGNVYQDRPCEGAQVGKEVRNFDPTPKPVASASTDSQCRQRGIDSQKIVWSREAGALAEKLMAHASDDEKSLIRDVYSKRGTAPEVRAAIEADCVAAKKQAELAAAMLAASEKLQGKNPASAAAAPARAAATDAKTTQAQPSDDASLRKVAEMKKALCTNIHAKLDDIQKNQRAGGSIATMESLNQRRRDVETERSRAGC
ncbi:MAG: hypothetical protein A3F78_01245 [Burkholderiales bacterium RIFCSPLOWO2_12_FULL_61_40]|nr:MAG: hypothetical protein A3F78_01245 [Burkholderiales bacterium RIFCSPLOWO2_12_FULL_61_40]